MLRTIRPILCACTILLFSCCFTPALAHPTAGAADYDKATMLLTEGKDFEHAITLLQAAVKAQPKDPDYHLALGCAYADRAASIGYADAWQSQYLRDKASYAKDLADWQADQKREPSHWPAPNKPPTTFQAYTKDDGKPLSFSHDQAQTRVAALANNAHAQYQSAILICKSKKARANVEYTEGWSILLIGTFSPKWTTTSGGKPGGRDALKDFQAATLDDPKNAIYWQSLGDASEGKSQISAYLRALALRPDNPDLWFHTSQEYDWDVTWGEALQHKPVKEPTNKPSPGIALAELRTAAKYDPGNAFPKFMLASSVLAGSAFSKVQNDPSLSQAQKEQADRSMAARIKPPDVAKASEALALLDSAIHAPHCQCPDYQAPEPAALRVAWRYGGVNGSHNFAPYKQLQTFAWQLYSVAIVDTIDHKITAAKHALNDVIFMGLRIAGSWPVKDSTLGSDEVMGPIMGRNVISIGYKGLMEVEQKYGTTAQLKEIQADYDTFKARVAKYKTDFNKNEPANIYAQY